MLIRMDVAFFAVCLNVQTGVTTADKYVQIRQFVTFLETLTSASFSVNFSDLLYSHGFAVNCLPQSAHSCFSTL